MSTFFESKKKGKKKANDEYNIILQNIDIAKIDKDFNIIDIKNINDSSELIFDVDEKNNTSSLEKLGIFSLKKQPIITIISKEKTNLKTFITMEDYKSKKKLPITTTIPCFGCHRKFSTIPIGIPLEYHPSIYLSKNDSTKIKKLTLNERKKLGENTNNDIDILEYFDTDGIVCSFNCIFSAIEDNPSPLYKKTQSLVPQLYKIIFGHYPKEKIIRSPSWKLREEYGGILTDEEFVKNLQMLKIVDMNQVDKIMKSMIPCSRVFKVLELENE
jgi:hypothetical protein